MSTGDGPAWNGEVVGSTPTSPTILQKQKRFESEVTALYGVDMSSPVKPEDFLAKLVATTQDRCTAISNALLAFPQLVYQFMKWIMDDDGNLTQEFMNQIYSVGDYKYSAASNLDTGGATSEWLYCNGDEKAGTDYPNVATLLLTGASSKFGAASVGNFKLPDFRGKFPMGVSAGHSIGSGGGVEDVTLTLAQVPAHTHDVIIPGDTGTPDNINSLSINATDAATNPQTFTTDSKGGGGSHTNMPPWIAAGYWYIKT